MSRRRWLRRQRGQNIVEFALLAVFLFTMVLGMIDFGRVFYAQVGLTNAAREGARYATLLDDPCGADLTSVRTRIKAEQPSLGITDSQITVDCSQADRRTVSLVYPVELASPFLDPLVGDGNGNVVLRSWAAMPVMSQ